MVWCNGTCSTAHAEAGWPSLCQFCARGENSIITQVLLQGSKKGGRCLLVGSKNSFSIESARRSPALALRWVRWWPCRPAREGQSCRPPSQSGSHAGWRCDGQGKAHPRRACVRKTHHLRRACVRKTCHLRRACEKHTPSPSLFVFELEEEKPTTMYDRVRKKKFVVR